MILKTKEGQQYCEELKKGVYQNKDLAKQSGTNINCPQSPTYQSPNSYKKQLSPQINGSNKVKRVVISAKEQNTESTSLDVIRDHQRANLVKQFPIPYTQLIPKKVDMQQISEFLRPRTSSLQGQSPQKHFNFNLPSSPTLKSIPQSTYVEKMVQKSAKKLVDDFQQRKEKQSILDKLTPRQYLLLTKQNVNDNSPSINAKLHKYAIWIPDLKSSQEKIEPFTTVHFNSKEIQEEEQNSSNKIQQDEEKDCSINKINIFSNIKIQSQQSPKSQQIKALPSITFKQIKEPDQINSPTKSNKGIMITQVDQSSQKITEKDLIYIEEEKEDSESKIISTQSLKSTSENTLTKIKYPIEPRFLTTSKKLQEFHKEQYRDQQEQYYLEKPDKINIGFVNNLIMNAKHIERIQGMYYQKQENLLNISQNVKERTEQKISKMREVARPPSKEQEEFTSYIKEYDKLKAESLERKHDRIMRLQINKDRKVIWRKFNIDNLTRSKSPPKSPNKNIIES